MTTLHTDDHDPMHDEAARLHAAFKRAEKRRANALRAVVAAHKIGPVSTQALDELRDASDEYDSARAAMLSQ